MQRYNSGSINLQLALVCYGPSKVGILNLLMLPRSCIDGVASKFYLKITVSIKGLLLWAVLTVAVCCVGLLMSGHEIKQILFACGVPVGCTLAYSVLIGRGKKSPNIPGDL